MKPHITPTGRTWKYRYWRMREFFGLIPDYTDKGLTTRERTALMTYESIRRKEKKRRKT